MLPLVPFLLATITAAAWLVTYRRGHALAARWVGLAGNGLVLVAALALPDVAAMTTPLLNNGGVPLAWDQVSRWGAATLALAAMAHQATPREELRAIPETLLVAVALLCLAAGNARWLAITMGLVCVTVIWVEGSLPAGSRSPFAVPGLAAILVSLGMLGLFSAWHLQVGSLAAPFWMVVIAVFGQAFGSLLLGYPALRWPTIATLTVTAALILQRVYSPVSISPTAYPLSLVIGGVAVLSAGSSAALWGPRGRALDALYSLSFGAALLAMRLDGSAGVATPVLALLGAVLSYSSLVALERAEGNGWYALPRVVAVGALAGLIPGPLLAVRWRVLAATLALGDGWLALWQMLAAVLACWVAALLLAPWLLQLRRTVRPTDWVAWGLGAFLSTVTVVLGVAPALLGQGLGWFGSPSDRPIMSLVLTLLPMVLAVGLAFWPVALRAQARASSWRWQVRPVWQGAWEALLLGADRGQQVAARLLYLALRTLEERFIIIWGLLCVLTLLLVALESGL